MKRLFSLLLLLIIGIQLSYGGINESSKLDDQVENQIQSKFLINDLPIRYHSNIMIRIQGNATKDDSLIFKQLVDTLNVLIDKWDVYLISSGTSNLVVNITNPPAKETSEFPFQQQKNGNDLIMSTVSLNMAPNMEFAIRKKIIFFNLLRSLVIQITNPKEKGISGSVFTEATPNKIIFHPIDFRIIKELYSSKYNNVSENQSSSNKWAGYNYKLLINLIAIVISMIYLILISQRGLFKKHQYKFGEFLKQGFLAFIAFLLYYGIQYFLTALFLLKSTSMASFSIIIILSFGLIGLISIVFIFLIERFLLKSKENLFLGIAVPFLTTMVIPVLIIVLGFIVIEKNSAKFQETLWWIITPMISFTTLIAIARAFYIFMNKQSESIILAKDVELAQISELQKQAELQSLRAKINPHFLYNALNSIASLATTDARKTEQMALALSDFFKYAINREQKQLNSLSEELNATLTYLEIEKVRFGDRLNFEIDCEPELMEIQIPQLLIQPLVENSIKHGLSQITENGMIRIVITNEGNQLNIRVYDNGPAFPDGPLSGFGIQNTQERIVLLYGSKATINWNNEPEKYIELSLPIVAETI